MWSLFAPLGKPSRFSNVLSTCWKCTTYRQSSQSSGGNPINRRPWTAEEDRKLRDLVQQGFAKKRIASEMSDRPYTTVEWRVDILKASDNKPPTAEGERVSRRPWTTGETALVQEKRRQGVPISDIAKYLPDRTLTSIRVRVRRLSVWPDPGRRRAKDFTEEELQRIVEMRVEGGKTYYEIALEMESSTRMIEYVWQRRCLNLVSKEERKSIWWRKAWTPNEEQHLLELHRRGTINSKDAARQFPSRTESAYVQPYPLSQFLPIRE